MVINSQSRVPPLTQLYVYVTDACNCSCQHCWIFSGFGAAKKKTTHHLAPDIFEAAVAEARPLGLSSVKWTGGEPTIHPDLPALLRLQKKLGLSGRLETNGLEVTPALAKLLRESGVTTVAVSLDGSTPETHDAIRGIRGAYRRALRGVRYLLEAGFKPQLIMTLMAPNIGELDGLLELALKLGVGSVKFNLVQPTLRGKEIHAEGKALEVEDFLNLNKRLEKELRPRYPFPISFDIPLAFRPLARIMSGEACSVCGIKTILGLLAEGSYALCGIGENLPELVFGRAGKGELNDIWGKHPALRQIRHDLPNRLKGVCGRCLMASLCLGSCVAQNYYRSRDLLGAFWFCEIAERRGFFPNSRLSPNSLKKNLTPSQ